MSKAQATEAQRICGCCGEQMTETSTSWLMPGLCTVCFTGMTTDRKFDVRDVRYELRKRGNSKAQESP
jgi:hypothetical protein